jgi:hypothetical protein
MSLSRLGPKLGSPAGYLKWPTGFRDDRVTISDKNRARFEEIGFELIHRELALGDFTFLGIGAEVRSQAKEWVEEKQAEIRNQREAARELETNRFETLRRWTIVAAVASIIAALAGLIAAFK